ncbi:trypsin-like serine peptidase [Amycolatopsis rhizosphaerae]|nr:trypsin-like serine protease [Amycolatopsis rhizosphaerae]
MATKMFTPAGMATISALLALCTACGSVTGNAESAGGSTGNTVPESSPVAHATTPGTTTGDTTVTPAPAPPAGLAVGALFSGDSHFCTASVIHSPAGNVVLTAAHCLSDGSGAEVREDLTFVPGYHDGAEPVGRWTVTETVIPAGWSSDSDPDLDFAFLIVHQDGNPASVESVAGANLLGHNRGFSHEVTVSGYPDSQDAPLVCHSTSSEFTTYQEQVACPGFTNGTSGGPWVTDVDPATGYGTVIGVIGGYQEGGDTADLSYSAYFDSDIQHLFDSIGSR